MKPRKIKLEIETDTEEEAKRSLEGMKFILNMIAEQGLNGVDVELMLNIVPTTDSWLAIGELKPKNEVI